MTARIRRTPNGTARSLSDRCGRLVRLPAAVATDEQRK
jgi:hypothetical protein